MADPSARQRWIALALAGSLLFATSLGAAETPAAPGPQPIIEQLVADVLAILRDGERPEAERRAELEALASEHFDFRTMARLVLSKNWRRLSEQQQLEFVDQFTIYLANDYGNRLERYDQEDVAVLGEDPKPRGDVVVKTKIVGGENDGALLDYRMRNRDGTWRIIDVVIEGISLVANFRDQFREVLSNGGPERLLEKLREKNDSAETA